MSTIFSDKEKCAIAGALSAVVYADDFVHNKEIDYMARVKYSLGISDELYEEGINMDATEGASIISAMSAGKKQLIGEIIVRMLHIDGTPEEEEERAVEDIARRCGLTLSKK